MQSLHHRLWPRLWSAMRDELGWGFVGSIAVLWLSGYVAEEVMAGRTLALDHSITQTIRAISHTAVTYSMLGISMLGDWSVLLAASLVAGWLWWQRGQKERVIILTTTFLGSALLSLTVSGFFHRFRPAPVDQLGVAQTYGLGSGHVLFALGCYGILAYLLLIDRPSVQRWRGLGLALFLTLTISLSRVYLGVHYPSDVLAGLIAGGVWLTANTLAFHNVRRLSPLWRLTV